MPADLTLSSFAFTDTTWETGDVIALSFSMQNTGTDELNSNYVRIGIVDSNGDFVGFMDDIQTASIAAGQTVPVTANLVVHNMELPAGSYSAFVRFDSYGPRIFEQSSLLNFTTTGVEPFSIYDDSFTATTAGTYDALAGDDFIEGSSGDDTLFGNDGDDFVYVDGGDDVAYGGNGDDRIHATYSFWNGSSSIQTLPGSNELYGDAGNDRFSSYGLQDTIDGGTGNDTIEIFQIDMTQAEADVYSGSTLYGGDGDDTITSRGTGMQYVMGATIYGGAGDDMISTNNAADVVFGGGGADTIDLNLAPLQGIVLQKETARVGDGPAASGGGGNDNISGTRLNDNLKGGSGEDVIRGGIGADLIKGGSGADQLHGQRGDDNIKGGGGADVINGNKGSDRLAGGRGDDKLNGSRGNDVIDGNKGDDKLIGGKGNDELDGGKGDDIINGGKGTDVLTGGLGADVFVFANGDGNNTITDFEDGVDMIEINASANAQGSLIVASHADGALLTFGNVTVLIEDVSYTDITLDDITF